MPAKLDKVKQEVIDYYQQGHSLTETRKYFGVSMGATYNFLVKHGVQLRSQSEGNKLKWTPDVRKKQSEDLKGNSRALGKNWTYDRPIYKPSLRGEKNPRWQGGKTSLNIAIRNLSEYSLWRKNVFKRDNNTCVQCNITNMVGQRLTLEVDHIIPLSDIMQRYNITSVDEALVCDAIWDINNGRVLCKSCHKQTDTYAVKLLHQRRKNQKNVS